MRLRVLLQACAVPLPQRNSFVFPLAPMDAAWELRALPKLTHVEAAGPDHAVVVPEVLRLLQ
jgi:hypothetical protein